MKNAADSRRNFFKTAGLLSAGITILPSYTINGMFLPRKNPHGVKRTVRPVDGKWVPVVCWHDCGGRCALKALVVNNKIIRVKSDDGIVVVDQKKCVRNQSCLSAGSEFHRA